MINSPTRKKNQTNNQKKLFIVNLIQFKKNIIIIA